jgi:asparagine synthase (glutamine-hydrolysing)
MCRIAGIVGYDELDGIAKVIAMRDAMLHGGPDDAGVFVDNERGVALGHRRLSLIDLSNAGHQPMISHDEQLIIVFNGEIYNYLELRAELKSKRCIFKTETDTEVILQSYAFWGKNCFEKLEGMFALAIYDKALNEIILARDHAGIKPLYYHLSHDLFCFASETKAFLQLKKDWPANKDWKTYFLLLGHVPEPYTTLENVYMLPKGSLLTFNLESKKPVIKNYKDNKTVSKLQISAEEAAYNLNQLVDKSVKQHLISDAPIGLFLSGGVDSSILTIVAQKYLKENLHTLSIDFDETTFSEKYYQDIIIRKTGAKHNSFIVTKKIFEDSFEDIIAAMDQPSNDGINTYFISKYAKQSGLKAVLSGIGADEIFGGYPSFKKAQFASIASLVPKSLFSLASLSSNQKWKKIAFMKLGGVKGLYYTQRGFFTPKEVAILLALDTKQVEIKLAELALQEPTDLITEIEQMALQEQNNYMLNQLLKDTDYMSMWHSVEVRVPFLDRRIINYANQLPANIRFDKKLPKGLLIKAFKNELPSEIWNRPKRGFVFPFQQWMSKSSAVNTNNPNLQRMHTQLKEGTLHWSRFWAYSLVSKERSSINSW